MWILSFLQGYLLSLEVYIGIEASTKDKTPLRTRIVLDFEECVVNNKRHKVYIDTFIYFFFLTLCHCLKKCKKGNSCLTGTVKEKQLQNCPYKRVKISYKKKEGHIITKDINVIKWKDNKVVVFALNFESMGQVKH